MHDHCLVRSSMRYAVASCTLQRPARTNDIAHEGSMTMHVLDRPGIARRVAKTSHALGRKNRQSPLQRPDDPVGKEPASLVLQSRVQQTPFRDADPAG